MSGERIVQLVGGPWDGDLVEFQSGQTFLVTPDPAHDPGRYELSGSKTRAIWRETVPAPSEGGEQ